jgi:hypothetical protein
MFVGVTHAAVRTACRGDAVRRSAMVGPPTSPSPSPPPKGRRGVCSAKRTDRKLPAVSNEATKKRLSLAGRGRRAAPGEGGSCRRATSSARVAPRACTAPAGRPTGSPLHCPAAPQDRVYHARSRLASGRVRCSWGTPTLPGDPTRGSDATRHVVGAGSEPAPTTGTGTPGALRCSLV